LVALVVLPMVVQLPLERAVPYALAFAVAWLVITLPRSLSSLTGLRQRLAWVICCITVPLLLWLLRDHIPPAGLSVRAPRFTTSIEALVPGDPIKIISSAELSGGVIAFVSIRAPMGVAQSVIFEWRHGDLREQIRAEIHGTSGSGWRTWSRKQNFPVNSAGSW